MKPAIRTTTKHPFFQVPWSRVSSAPQRIFAIWSMCNRKTLPTARVATLPRHSRPTRQLGLTLIELLVGIALGLLVIAAAIGTLTVSHTTAGTVGDIAQLQQQGSYALRVIGLQLRQAGSQEPQRSDTNGLYSFDATYAGIDSEGVSVKGTDGADGDRLSVSNFSSPSLANTQRRSCLGSVVNANTTMDATFKRKASSNELLCVTTVPSGETQAIATNVTDFQVAYRVRSASGTRIMTAENVEGGNLWNSVSGIEVCIELKGDQRMPDIAATYTNCKNESTARGDKLRIVFRNTFDIRAGVLP
ncbi:PilW family protein [Variovorax sp. LT2P21]|uniref:PilW family protein n=1 Tax=Variovorax sp. LT2P21 TaxID=3443731 RepID=UPI003F47FA6D